MPEGCNPGFVPFLIEKTATDFPRGFCDEIQKIHTMSPILS
jgi:hypothetical protein